MLLLLLFTLSEAYMVSFITTVFAEYRGGAIVIVAASMTLGNHLSHLAIVVALTLYAMFTRNDFSSGYGILFGVIAPFMMFGIFAWISWIPVLHSLYCALGACLFSIYLVIDTQLIVGGGRYSLSMDDYVAGAMILYIDIIQIFLFILELLGS
jgi:FtsH-binding integral membrane protein